MNICLVTTSILSVRAPCSTYYVSSTVRDLSRSLNTNSTVLHTTDFYYSTVVYLPTFYSVRGQLLDERLESESYAKEKVGRSNKHHFRLVVAVALIFIVVFMEAVVMILKRPVMRKIVDQKT